MWTFVLSAKIIVENNDVVDDLIAFIKSKLARSKYFKIKRITDYKIRELPINFKEQESPIKSNNKKKINEDYLRVNGLEL